MEQAVYKIAVIATVFAVSLFAMNFAAAQQPQIATFQEQAQIVIDQKISNNATASITLLSTTNQEIQIPSELDAKIRNDGRILSIVLTNEEQCILGVVEQSCIMINVQRADDWEGIIEIQTNTREIGDSFIEDINEIFDTDAEFHSTYIHHRDETNVELGTSGAVSGRGTISAVYTMPMEDTDSMYQKISALLIPKIIRDSGGFYDVALNLVKEDLAKMTFSMIPQGSTTLYQLKTSLDHTDVGEISEINPLKFLKTDEIQRSDYFAGGFYPLNSILHVVVLSPEDKQVAKANSELLPTQIVGGEKVPTDISKPGWIFDPDSGRVIDAKYLFGEEFIATENQLTFTITTLGEDKVPTEIKTPPKTSPTQTIDTESLIFIIAIVAIAGGAAAFYLKGYKKNP